MQLQRLPGDMNIFSETTILTLFACVAVTTSRADRISTLEVKGLAFPGRQQMIENREKIRLVTVFSPEWRVFEERGARVADVRNTTEFLRLPADDIHDNSQVRIRVRFSNYTQGSRVGATSERSTLVEAEEKGLPDQLKIRTWLDMGRVRSYLVITFGDFWIEIDESSAKDERYLTRMAIQRINAFFQEAKSFANLNQIQIAFGKPADLRGLEVNPVGQRGIYRLSGYINPCEEGKVFIKVVRSLDLSQIAGAKAFRTSEFVGWSDNTNELFYLESQITMDGTYDRENAFLEIWFQPEPRKLFSTESETFFLWKR